jgi:hypothetical protein
MKPNLSSAQILFEVERVVPNALSEEIEALKTSALGATRSIFTKGAPCA